MKLSSGANVCDLTVPPEAEAYPADGRQELLAGCLTQLPAQIADVHVHHIALRVEVHVPYLLRSVVRLTTSSGWSMKYSSSWNSLGVRSRGLSLTVATCRSRSSATGGYRSTSSRSAPPRRCRARIRASSSSKGNGIER